MYQMPATYNPYADARWVELRFSFGVVAPEGAALAEPSSSGQSPVSQIGQSHDEVREMTAKYASLEYNLFLLDGSFALYPEHLAGIQTGWQSGELSGQDGVFASPPWLEFTFAEPQTSYGFTLIFDDKLVTDYPAEVKTTVYHASGQIIDSKTTTPAGYEHVVDLPSQDYSKVRFEFLKTNRPFRRVRLCEAVFGVIYAYHRGNIESATVQLAASPWAENLPSGQVSAVVNNQDKLYNMVNPTGVYAYLQDGQYMDYEFRVGGLAVSMGRLYFTTAQSEDGGLTAEITFSDWLYALDDIQYNQGESGTWTLGEAVTAILAAAGSQHEAIYEAGLEQIVIRKCIPQKTSCREALRLSAQAAMATCYVDRDNKLKFVRAAIGEKTDEWTRNVLYDEAQIKIGELYNVVKLTVRDEYNEGAETVYTAKNVSEGDYERVFDVQNPLVQDGQTVADWLLGWLQRRTNYDVTYRGNPALDLLDTVQIDDVYKVNGLAVLTEQNMSFDGGLQVDAAAIK